MFGFPILEYISEKDYLGAIGYVVGVLIVVFLLLPFHEFAHGWTADKLGDPTARYAGRLSLNPMRHVDWFGAALIMIAGFGWAKPVPVNLSYFKHPKRDMAITALAGPSSNLLMGTVAMFLAQLVAFLGNTFLGNTASKAAAIALLIMVEILITISQINIGLAVFNLIPIPPLDGSRLLTALLPDRFYYKIMQYEHIIRFALFVLVFTGRLTEPLVYLQGKILTSIIWLTGLPFGTVA